MSENQGKPANDIPLVQAQYVGDSSLVEEGRGHVSRPSLSQIPVAIPVYDTQAISAMLVTGSANPDEASTQNFKTHLIPRIVLLILFWMTLSITAVIIGVKFGPKYPSYQEQLPICKTISHWLIISGAMGLVSVFLMLVAYYHALKMYLDKNSGEEVPPLLGCLLCLTCLLFLPVLIFNQIWLIYGITIIFSGSDDIFSCAGQMRRFAKVYIIILIVASFIQCCYDSKKQATRNPNRQYSPTS